MQQRVKIRKVKLCSNKSKKIGFVWYFCPLNREAHGLDAVVRSLV
jgi:hypothetical protein